MRTNPNKKLTKQSLLEGEEKKKLVCGSTPRVNFVLSLVLNIKGLKGAEDRVSWKKTCVINQINALTMTKTTT